jgi:hypothetical protein
MKVNEDRDRGLGRKDMDPYQSHPYKRPACGPGRNPHFWCTPARNPGYAHGSVECDEFSGQKIVFSGKMSSPNLYFEAAHIISPVRYSVERLGTKHSCSVSRSIL